jgi:hypothetical protein
VRLGAEEVYDGLGLRSDDAIKRKHPTASTALMRFDAMATSSKQTTTAPLADAGSLLGQLRHGGVHGKAPIHT